MAVPERNNSGATKSTKSLNYTQQYTNVVVIEDLPINAGVPPKLTFSLMFPPVNTAAPKSAIFTMPSAE
jgi:hypothetical protein